MANNIRPSCMSKTFSYNGFIERTCKSINDIINRCGRKFDCDTRQMFPDCKCRDCGNLIGRSNIDHMTKEKRVIGCDEILMVFLITILLLFGLALHLIRRSNHAFLYGSGGCQSTIFRDCQIMA